MYKACRPCSCAQLSGLHVVYLPCVRACAARDKVIDLSVVCRLSSVRIRIGKSQHLSSGLLRQPQLMIMQRLVYSALIAKYCQLQDREYH